MCVCAIVGRHIYNCLCMEIANELCRLLVCIRACVRGVASGTASRALALLEFWLAGPIEPTFQRVFLAPLLDYWSDHFPVADSGGFLWFQFGSTRMRSDRRPSAFIFVDIANWLTVAPF